jgi:hypothetical protein
MTGLAVLVFLVITPAHAQEPLSCKLLQPSEIESALGGKAATKFSGFTYNLQDIAMDDCKVEIAMPGQGGRLQVTIHIVKNLPMDGGDFIRRRNGNAARQEQWKMKGAQFEEKTLGKAIYYMSGRPNVAAHSACSIPRARGYIEVDVIAPSQKEMPSMDAVCALVHKAATRL